MEKGTGERDIYIKLFGFFDVLYKDKTIFFDNVSSVKALMLLKFLLMHKNKEYMPETIAENVWPENNYFDVKKVVRTYIHRLRKIISLANRFKEDFSNDIRILNIKGSYRLELSEHVRLDIDLFEHYCSLAEAEKNTQMLEKIFDNIVEIYNGEFLQDSPYEQWVVMYRNYYHRNFCKAVSTMLLKFEEKKEYEVIIELCERSFQIYDLDENMNIIFLKALIALDKVNDALQHYDFITAKMYQELSTLPSEKLREISNQIKPMQAHNGENQDSTGVTTYDEQKLRLLIGETVKSYMSGNTVKYATGFVRLEESDIVDNNELESHENTNLQVYLKEALEYALRKNDMYVFFSEYVAVIIVLEVREDFFQTISSRISESFHKRYKGFKYKIKIDILPVNIVL